MADSSSKINPLRLIALIAAGLVIQMLVLSATTVIVPPHGWSAGFTHPDHALAYLTVGQAFGVVMLFALCRRCGATVRESLLCIVGVVCLNGIVYMTVGPYVEEWTESHWKALFPVKHHRY